MYLANLVILCYLGYMMYPGKVARDTAGSSNEPHRVVLIVHVTTNAIIQAVDPRTDRFFEYMTCVARELLSEVCIRAQEESHSWHFKQNNNTEAMMKGFLSKSESGGNRRKQC